MNLEGVRASAKKQVVDFYCDLIQKTYPIQMQIAVAALTGGFVTADRTAMYNFMDQPIRDLKAKLATLDAATTVDEIKTIMGWA